MYMRVFILFYNYTSLDYSLFDILQTCAIILFVNKAIFNKPFYYFTVLHLIK